MAWARENPEIRLPKLAEEIYLFAKNGEHDTKAWSALALEVLELSPNRIAILDAYASRFYPSVCSGELANALCPYLALAEQMKTHNDPLVADWAKKQASFISQRIAEDRTRERRVDESFE